MDAWYHVCAHTQYRAHISSTLVHLFRKLVKLELPGAMDHKNGE